MREERSVPTVLIQQLVQFSLSLEIMLCVWLPMLALHACMSLGGKIQSTGDYLLVNQSTLHFCIFISLSEVSDTSC